MSTARSLLRTGQRMRSGQAQGWTPRALRFDGSTNYFARGGDLTSNADGKVGLLSFWARVAANNTDMFVYRGVSGVGYIRRPTTNTWTIVCQTSTPTIIMSLTSAPIITSALGWHHVLAAWDLAAGRAQLYINGRPDLTNTPTATDDTIDYTRTNHGVGAVDTGSLFFNGDLADFYYNFAETLDLSIPENRYKFIAPDGAPVYLGNTGELPTGTSPIMFFRGPTAQNSGTGGSFTVNGTFTDVIGP